MLKLTHLHLNDIPFFQIFWFWMKMSGLYSGWRRVPGARFWAGTTSKRLQLFTKSLLRGSSFWNSIPLPARGVHCSFILSPLFYTLGAPGRPWGLALPGPHIGIYGFQWWREPRLAGIVDTAFAEEQSHPGARDRSDEAGTRTQQHSGSQAPAEPQLNPTGPRGPP